MLRDRDAILTSENIIFRVYGYFHPPEGYVCDVEYAPSKIYKSNDPRAIRRVNSEVYYKFYADEGLRFILENYPKYTIQYRPLGRRLVGVPEDQIRSIRRPNDKLQELLLSPPTDELLVALHELIDMVLSRSNLSSECLGVFGSILHGFYHPKLSDIDLTVYGRRRMEDLRKILKEFYMERDSPLRNEFEDESSIIGKRWRFLNYGLKEYLWHQRRKLIYAVFKGGADERAIKVEFEPVREWDEIYNEYDPRMRIVNCGWIRAVARITDSTDSPFIPSIYMIEPLKIIDGPKVDDIKRIISYVEEFRMQAFDDEIVYVEGNLEYVEAKKSFYQITLTYRPRYYHQVLKVLRSQ